MDTFFSVIMPVFNRPQYIEKAVGSVLNQTYKNFELLIVDDGSENAEVGIILNKYKSFPQIKVFYQAHKGPGASINYGVPQAKGEYVCRLDSDDLLFPQALETLSIYIEKFPKVDYFYSSRCTIDEKDRFIRTFKSIRFDKKRLLRRHIANHFICWKKQSFLEVGGFDESIRYGEDYDLALRMAERFQFQNIKEVLYKVRRGSYKDRVTFLFKKSERTNIIEQLRQRANQRLKLSHTLTAKNSGKGGNYGKQ